MGKIKYIYLMKIYINYYGRTNRDMEERSRNT